MLGNLKLWAVVSLGAIAAFFKIRYQAEKNKSINKDLADQKKINAIVTQAGITIVDAEGDLENELQQIDDAVERNDFSGMQ